MSVTSGVAVAHGVDIALVLCPTWTVDKPLLALGYLLAAVRAAGYSARGYDFNVDFYNEIKDVRPHFKGLWGSRAWRIGVSEYFFPILYPDRFPALDEFAAEISEVLNAAAVTQAERLLADDPRAVGFSVMGNTALTSLLVARELKRRRPEVRVVFGGPGCHEGTNEEFYLRTGWVDAVVIGEGEETLVELMPHLIREGRVPAVPGTKTRLGHGINRGDARTPIKPIDSIAFPDYSDFSRDAYHFRYRELSILLSRGCVAKCTFCADFPFWGRWRTRDGHQVAAEMIHQFEQYGTREFFFADLMLNGSPREVERLAERLVELGTDFSWGGNARVMPMFSEALLAKMHRAGCRYLHYGLEHGSDTVLKAMRKAMSVKRYQTALERAERQGILISAGFIVGHPSEGDAEFDEMMAFVRHNYSRMKQIHCSPLTLIPGAPMYSDLDRDQVVLPGEFPMPRGMEWAANYRYPFCSGWTTRDGKNTEQYRLSLVERFNEGLKQIVRDQEKAIKSGDQGVSGHRHGVGLEGLYEEIQPEGAEPALKHPEGVIHEPMPGAVADGQEAGLQKVQPFGLREGLAS